MATPLSEISWLTDGGDRPVRDQWSRLAYKHVMRPDAAPGLPAPWYSHQDWRRLKAFELLSDYVGNTARWQLGPDVDPDDRTTLREYGDPEALVDTIRSIVLGQEQTVAVEDADDDPAAKAVEDWLRDWARAVDLPAKMLLGEARTITYGTGVWTLWWSQTAGRPLLRLWDPGHYFPDLDDTDEQDFPRRVDFIWEEDAPRNDPDSRKRKRVNVVTYELGGIEPAPERLLVGSVVRLFRGARLREGDQQQPGGRITRTYPWNDRPSTETCYVTQAWWYRDDLSGDLQSVRQFPTSKANYVQMADGTPIDRYDLGLDFLPLVAVPHQVTDPIEHFGQSALAKVLQAFDDLSATDSDLQRATSTAGSPPVGLTGVSMGEAAELKMGPGEIWGLGEGKASMLDTSPQLSALAAASSRLQDRISELTRVSSVIAGRVKPSEVPSGLALQIGLVPTDSLVRELRIARAGRYQLLLKMAQRIAMAHGKFVADQKPRPAEVRFGAYLPTDLTSLVQNLVLLLQAHGLSTETIVRAVQEAGLPIDDVDAEVARIDSRDVVQAEGIVAATGDEARAAELLGATPAPVGPPAVPQIILPSGVQRPETSDEGSAA